MSIVWRLIGFGGAALMLFGMRSAAVGQGSVLDTPVHIPGLTPAETRDFTYGANGFRLDYGPFKGLGPIFNGNSCGECHRAGGLGGGADDLLIGRTARIGAIKSGKYTDLVEVGGPTIQRRSLHEIFPDHTVMPEVVPPEAQFVSKRLTPPLFGAGLIEAIPDAEILSLEKTPRPDGIHGIANRVKNPETGKVELGRFGWKGQISTIHWFVCDANLNEMGVTTATFPHELLPQGRPYKANEDATIEPEQREKDLGVLTAFIRFLAPPTSTNGSGNSGKAIFDRIACAACHVPSLKTGPNSVAALSNVTANLYSDLLLHKMGSELADGIRQEKALGDQFRTPPLWGLSLRKFFLHDGRVSTIDGAIRAHGGEATASRDRFAALPESDRKALLEFLNGL